MKKYLLLLITCLAFNTAQAQRGARNDNPETRAQRQTKMMVDSLALSEAQAEKVSAVNLTYAKKMTAAMQEARQSEDFDRAKMREQTIALRQEQHKAVSKFLTKEQAEKWMTIQSNQRTQGRGKGPRGSQKRKKKEDSSSGTR